MRQKTHLTLKAVPLAIYILSASQVAYADTSPKLEFWRIISLSSHSQASTANPPSAPIADDGGVIEDPNGVSVDSNNNLSINITPSGVITASNSSDLDINVTGIDYTAERVVVTARDVNGKTKSAVLAEDYRYPYPSNGQVDNDQRWLSPTLNVSDLAPGNIELSVKVSATGYKSATASTIETLAAYSPEVVEIYPITGDDFVELDERDGVDKKIEVKGRILDRSTANPYFLQFSINNSEFVWYDTSVMPSYPYGRKITDMTWNGDEFSFTLPALEIGSDLSEKLGIITRFLDGAGNQGNSYNNKPFTKEDRNSIPFIIDKNLESSREYKVYTNIAPSADGADMMKGNGTRDPITQQYSDYYTADLTNPTTVEAGDELWEQYHYIGIGEPDDGETFTLTGYSITSYYSGTPDTVTLQYLDTNGQWKALYTFNWYSVTKYYEFLLETPVEAKAARVYFHHRNNTNDLMIYDVSIHKAK